jgi:hypothetical protein
VPNEHNASARSVHRSLDPWKPPTLSISWGLALQIDPVELLKIINGRSPQAQPWCPDWQKD